MIKKIFYEIFGLMKHNKELEVVDNHDKDILEKDNEECNCNQSNNEIILSMTFLINNKGHLFIDGDWAESSKDMAEIFGAFLYVLNNGELKQNIIQYLMTLKEDSSLEFQSFINNIVKKWDELIGENSDEPIVQPSKAFTINQLKLADTEGDEDE